MNKQLLEEYKEYIDKKIVTAEKQIQEGKIRNFEEFAEEVKNKYQFKK